MLAIGGSDPCGGAGIQADIVTARSLGLHAMSAITGVTAQNSHCVFSSGEISPKLLKQQLDAVSEECQIDGIKIGLLLSIPQIEIVSDFIKSLPNSVPVVIDPVLKATATTKNFSSEPVYSDFLSALIKLLFPRATIVTPNLEEGSVFISKHFPFLKDYPNQIDLGQELLKWWECKGVILKGGHSKSEEISDILFLKEDDSIRMEKFTHSKLDCHNLHGTGCVFASLLSAYLILGHSIPDAFRLASEQMQNIIQRSIAYELKGNSLNGPLNITDYNVI